MGPNVTVEGEEGDVRLVQSDLLGLVVEETTRTQYCSF